MKRFLLMGTAVHLLLLIDAHADARWTIEVDATVKRGSSRQRLEGFIGVQGSPMGAGDQDGSNEASRRFEMAAWRALDPTTDSIFLIDGAPGGGGFYVVRATDPDFEPGEHLIGPVGPKRDIYIDPRGFDAMRGYFKDTNAGTGFSKVFSFGYTPKSLSSNPSADNFATYPPTDYAEWRAVVEAIVRHMKKYGIDDPYINIYGEPESDTIWNVLAPDGQTYPISTEPVIREYVRMLAESQRAIKAADPGAKAAAMCAGVWSADLFRDLRQAPDQKGLDDFIAYVREFNESLPPGAKPVELDNICWQGYSWRDEKRITPMTEHIRSVLRQNGFNPDTPQYLMGWSGGWASPQGNRYPLMRDAAHLVYNVLDQVNPGGKPGVIARAHYYTWNLEDGSNKSSLVRTVHREISYDGGATVTAAASDKDCLRPAYMAFLAIKALEDGTMLATNEERPELARSMASVNQKTIHVLLVNYTDDRQSAQITLKNLPKTARLEKAVLRRVPKNEMCGTGEWFPANDPLSTLRGEPAKLTSMKEGSASTTVLLPVNGVALLEIPR